jgi:type VI secretion system protein ImpK
MNDLREKLLAQINAQEERAKTAGIPMEQFREARFAVLAWVDEMILNSDWPHRTHWQHLMLTYYGTLNAGEDFFRHLDLLPADANPVREIYYLCLCLGFEGRYAFGDSRRELAELKQRLYKQLCSPGGDIRQNYPRLFPEAYQRAAAAAAPKKSISPYWYAAACAVPLLLFALFFFLLRNEANRVLAQLVTQPQLPKTVAWEDCLIQKLTANRIPAENTPRGVRITLKRLLFPADSPVLSAEAKEAIKIVYGTLRSCNLNNEIEVEGHASKEGNDARNEQLAVQRAQSVERELLEYGVDRNRISMRGWGSRQPLPGAPDPENRRVEIIIRR